MVERIPQHRHCHFCDKAISIDRQYCDEKCESEHMAVRKGKRKQLTTFYVIMLLIFVFAMALTIL